MLYDSQKHSTPCANPITHSTSSRDDWLLYLTREERATFIATFGGWALDGMT